MVFPLLTKLLSSIWIPFSLGLLESNPFMECFGRVGFMRPEWFKLRRVIFGIAMIFSTIGWTSMLLTDLAISDSYHILKSFHFSKGDVNYIFGGPNGTSFVNGDTTIYVGLRAVGWSRTFLNITSDDIDRVLNASVTLEESDFAALLETFRVREQTVSSFGDFCDGDNGVWFVESDQCDSCEKASTKMIRRYVVRLYNDSIFHFLPPLAHTHVVPARRCSS